MRALRESRRGLAALLALALVVLWGTNPVGAQNVIVGGGGSATFNGGAVTGVTSFLDGTNFSLKNTADPTKIAQFSVVSISGATTRTFTLPDASSTFCVAGVDCAPTANQTYGSLASITFPDDSAGPDTAGLVIGGASGSRFKHSSNRQTAPGLQLGLHANNYFMVGELADIDFNYAYPAQTDPTVVVRTHNQTTTEYGSYRASGTQTELFKTLTESSATAVVQIGIASGSFTGGSIEYTVVASDGTDHQSRHGRTIWQGVNKAGTETCTITPTAETTDGSTLAASTGTLTYTWAADTAPTNGCNFTLNAVSSLTQTVLRVYYTVVVDGPATVTPQ